MPATAYIKKVIANSNATAATAGNVFLSQKCIDEK
jgi:hypothetical protein